MSYRQFREIRLRDFRCFNEQQTARLAPLTLLVGENSTGQDLVSRRSASGLGCRPRKRRTGFSQGPV